MSGWRLAGAALLLFMAGCGSPDSAALSNTGPSNSSEVDPDDEYAFHQRAAASAARVERQFEGS